MWHEALQWTVLAVLAFLVLGIFRQIAVFLPAEPRSATSSGPKVGHPLPRKLLDAVKKLFEGLIPAEGAVLAFVVEDCVGCGALLGQLKDSETLRRGQTVILVARAASPEFRTALAETGLPAIIDDGTYWEECRVTNTPLVLRIDQQGKVVAKGVTHRVDSVALVA
jgi:hypothetical protein